MRFRLSATLPLPICVLLLTTCTLFAQDSDNPFSDQSDPFGTTTKVAKPGARAPIQEDFESEKLKAFEADLQRFRKEHANMLKREQALTGKIEKLLEDIYSEVQTPLGDRHALVHLNPPINLADHLDSYASNTRQGVSDLTARFESVIQEGLDSIAKRNNRAGNQPF